MAETTSAYEVAQFTKDRPCSKVEMWNCFFGGTPKRDGSTPKVLALSIIGRHAYRALLLAGRAKEVVTSNAPVIVLTEEGDGWLRQGTRRYANNHPERAHEIQNPPRIWRLRRGNR